MGEVVEWEENGQPKRMIGVHVDVDAQTRAREQLAALERQLRLFVEHIPAAVAMFDRDMRYLVASEGWYDQYGIEDNIIGRSHYEVFPDIPERWKEIHREVLGGRAMSNDRDAFERADGSTTWVRWALRPWYDAENSIGGIVMFTEVINDQVEREQALEHLNDELRTRTEFANRMASKAQAASKAKSEFLANMSHEIRTPMTAILGYADMLDARRGVDPDAIAPIGRRSNATHLLAVINDILDMSKIEAGRMNSNASRRTRLRSSARSLSLVAPAPKQGLEVRAHPIRHADPERSLSDPTGCDRSSSTSSQRHQVHRGGRDHPPHRVATDPSNGLASASEDTGRA